MFSSLDLFRFLFVVASLLTIVLVSVGLQEAVEAADAVREEVLRAASEFFLMAAIAAASLFLR